jgi:non-ribosomal peptide synthase protein (TIGR01720 family)
VTDHYHGDEIAIIGMSCRLPGAASVTEFWRTLREGIESIRLFSDDELLAAGVDRTLLANPNYVKAKGVLDDPELFDAAFFGFSPKEAEVIDPQHRLFLELAWEALEDAGYNVDTYDRRVGVFAGSNLNTYLLFNLVANQEVVEPLGRYQTMLASDKDFLATRVSYKLNLKGPSVTVQTACSTSLVAVHFACQSLLNGECDIALAGGVSIVVPQKSGYLFQEGGIFSPDGHCRAFDAEAQGCVEGSGVGIVVLKRLSEAIFDRDSIRAVIKGSAINNDGSAKVGYTAPSVDGQRAVIADALAVARVSPETIQYVEAHGTGTALGDPIEIAALTQVFRKQTERKRFCAVGSVKTNIGHLDAAAGVAGLIKTVLALEDRVIPPSLGYERPNPRIDFDNSPFYVNSRLAEWPDSPGPRRACVSSFGIGGTNAHVVLEEAPAPPPPDQGKHSEILILSARTRSALETATSNLAVHLKQNPQTRFADLAYTLQTGRKQFNHRRALICHNVDEAIDLLETRDSVRVLTGTAGQNLRPVMFMFSGQGSQHVNMGRELYSNEPLFRSEVDRCCELLKPSLGIDLCCVLYPDEAEADAAAARLNQTRLTQPALFVVEYALAKLWMALGLEPAGMIGHSVGEYVAACLAGIFSLEDALSLVAARGEMMQSLPPGAMFSLQLNESEAARLLDGSDLSIAAVNGPSSCVVSGPITAIERLEKRLASEGVSGKRLRTSHAFHSAMMSAIVRPFAERAGSVELRPPAIRFVSNVSGAWIRADEATDPAYWARHLRQSVRFNEGVGELLREPGAILLEVGPGNTLAALARRHPEKQASHLILSTLPHFESDRSDEDSLLATAGRLWIAGANVKWSELHRGRQLRRIPLPTHPFERQRYWIEPKKGEASRSSRDSASSPDWLYVPMWRESLLPPPYDLDSSKQEGRIWLVFLDDCGLADRIVERLVGSSIRVITVGRGPQFQRMTETDYLINPTSPEDYDALVAELSASGAPPAVIAHLWSVSTKEPPADNLTLLEESQASGFYSLLFLAQALGKHGIAAPVHIGVVTTNLVNVSGNEETRPEKATVLGPCRVIPDEFPSATCACIDVSVSQSDDWNPELVDRVITEVATPSADTLIALRGNRRWVQSYEPILRESVSPLSSSPRERPVYLITGGLGGVGFELARHLALSVRARLVLTGRTRLPEPSGYEEWIAAKGERDEVSQRVKKLLELEAAGADVLAVTADAADLDQMRYAFDLAYERFGRIDGIIHAAGIAGGGVISLKDRETAAAVLAPKVRGTMVLNELMLAREIDFLALCSSLNSFTGGFGQADYCAANAFLDTFAQGKKRSGARIISINWDEWRETGMARRGARSRRQVDPVSHPLLDGREATTPQTYLTWFSPQRHWVLDAHRILGNPVVPGTAYLEMVRAAVSGSAAGPIEMREVFFVSPLRVGDGEEMEVETVIKEDGTFVVRSRHQSHNGAARWQEHAIGKCAFTDDTGRRRIDLQNHIDRCNLAFVDGEQEEHKETDLDPRWDTFKSAYLGKDELVAQFELPETYVADGEALKLHPALLDAATGVAKKYLAEDGVYLPLSYKRLTMKAPLTRRIYSHAKRRRDGYSTKEIVAYDVLITDPDGAELVEIEEYAAKRVNDIDGQMSSLVDTARTERSPENLRAESTKVTGTNGLMPVEAIKIFDWIVANRVPPQIVVSKTEPRTLIEESRLLSRSLSSGEIASSSTDSRTPHARPDIQTPYEPPRNEIEQRLAILWQEILGITGVGIQDNFFELGGDSVLSFQVVARASRFGIQLSPQQIFQHQTIAELSDVITGAERDTGPFPLTPAQHQFFEIGLDRAPGSVRVFLVSIANSVGVEVAEAAFRSLVSHHEALRIRFERQGGRWQQQILDTEEAVSFAAVNGFESRDELMKAVEAEASALRSSIGRLESALFRARHFRLDRGEDSRLMLAAHEMVVDRDSWPVLLRDFQLLCDLLLRAQEPLLPHKPPLFRRWVEDLKKRAESRPLAAEWAPYWSALPVDYPGNSNDGAGRLAISLDVEETKLLMSPEVQSAYRTEVSDLLITALAQTIFQFAGEPRLLFTLETNWRQSREQALDLSRAVGCYDAEAPLLIELDEMQDPSAAIRSIKEQLRTASSRGFDYGPMSHSPDTPLAAEKRSPRKPQLSFAFDAGDGELLSGGGGLLKEAVDLGDESSAPQLKHGYLISIRARVSKGALKIDWLFDSGVYRSATVERLATKFKESLQSLIVHCRSAERGFTPSDFTLARLDQNKLRKLAQLIDEADDSDLEVAEE